MKGLTLFTRTSAPSSWIVAAWHSPHSLTWRWGLMFSRFRGDERRVWPLWYAYRANGGPHWGIRFPFVGILFWQQQQPLWYRDLYRRMQDERREAETQAEAAMRLAARAAAGHVVTMQSTLIIHADGGASLH